MTDDIDDHPSRHTDRDGPGGGGDPSGEDFDGPVGSCGECGSNVYADDYDGSGLCDQCRWYAEQGGEG